MLNSFQHLLYYYISLCVFASLRQMSLKNLFRSSEVNMKHYRKITKNISGISLTLLFLAIPHTYSQPVLITTAAPIHITDSGTDRATAYQMQNKIITSSAGDTKKTYFAYSKNGGGKEFIHWKTMTVWVAAYNHETGRIENDTFIGNQFDNHGCPSLTIDKEGYLHIVYGPHHHPIRYRKSLHPNDSTSWTAEEHVSAVHGQLEPNSDYGRGYAITGEMTYPIVKVDSNGTIHVAASLSNAVCYVRKKNGAWEKPRIIFESSKRFSRYDVMMNVDRNDRVHIMAPDLELEAREGKLSRGNLDYFYFLSENGGDRFTKKEHAWSLSDGYGQGGGSIAFDRNNNPHFLVVERDYGASKRVWLVYRDGTGWKKYCIEVPGKRIWQSKLTIDAQGGLLIILQASDSSTNWRDNSNALYLAYCKNGVLTDGFTIRKIGEPSGGKNPWLPTIQENERYGEFDIQRFFVMWIDDEPGNPNILGSLVKTNVYAREISVCAE